MNISMNKNMAIFFTFLPTSSSSTTSREWLVVDEDDNIGLKGLKLKITLGYRHGL